ncbi:MAG TPA: flagellar biosynthesis anti-sigma factor FlgM [Methylomirabilota bacterium]|jgi:flagellar biosynthesis anti-sigma factor FlgM|nr:flagellar biosynthesis anti-sigma factor FlgM [Methylomirabilota bacterium]
MKIADKGPVDVNVSQLVRGDSAVSAVRGKGDKRHVEQTDDAAQVSISTEARKLQKVAALAERGDEMRTEKLRQLKAQIENGAYHVEALDVARSIARHELSRLLGKA